MRRYRRGVGARHVFQLRDLAQRNEAGFGQLLGCPQRAGPCDVQQLRHQPSLPRKAPRSSIAFTARSSNPWRRSRLANSWEAFGAVPHWPSASWISGTVSDRNEPAIEITLMPAIAIVATLPTDLSSVPVRREVVSRMLA